MKPTLATVLDRHLGAFLANHKIPLYQLKALESYRRCRTAALGSHSQYCENGHLMGIWYSSCRRRGCTQCQGLANANWLAAQKARLLSVTHHHWIFTLPHDLLPLWCYNRGVLQNILFKAVASVIATLSADSRYLDAQPGYLLALHTWGRNLSLHPHIHCLISHGGVNAAGHWIEPKKACLFPARVMMQLFRGKFLAAVVACDDLVLPPDLSPARLRRLLNKLGQTDWVVHCCKPYRHGRGVAAYLSRYVKAGPMKNNQIRRLDEGGILFRYHNHRTSREATQRLTGDTFIARLCNHIPLRGKPTVRYYGLYHACRRRVLNIARRVNGQSCVRTASRLTWQRYLERRDHTPTCPSCGGQLQSLVAET